MDKREKEDTQESGFYTLKTSSCTPDETDCTLIIPTKTPVKSDSNILDASQQRQYITSVGPVMK